jgi:hypothetical protein
VENVKIFLPPLTEILPPLESGLVKIGFRKGIVRTSKNAYRNPSTFRNENGYNTAYLPLLSDT